MQIKFNKKSQLTIFLIVSLIVIFSLVFLVSSSISKKNDIVKSYKNQIDANSNSKLILLKDNVDFCLNKELKKALIIAGFNGGFIYDNGEYYTGSVILPTDYNRNLISNLKLNWNNLHSRVLFHYQSEVFTPILNDSYIINLGPPIGNKIIYNNSIGSEFEKYILNGFLNCINLDKYKNSGYTIIKENNLGSILEISGLNIKVTNILGKIKDKIVINFLGNNYYGNITNIDNNLNITQIKLKTNLPIGANVNLNDITARNLNSSISLNVIFNNENVIAKLYFPITIKKGDFSTSYTSGVVSSNIRFKTYLKLSNLLLNAKKENRSLDYSNLDDLNRILNMSAYFKNTSLNNFKILETRINDSSKYKLYIYSIIDFDSKIYGSPYIFNFAYENEAPKIDLSRLGGDFFDNNSILFIASKNFTYSMNLQNLVTDKQYFDKYKFYFKPEEISIPGLYDYSINLNGDLSFIAYVENSFSFKIELSDGEATRVQHFTFVTGFPDNSKNSAAIDCLSFENFGDSDKAFPIDLNYSNKIYNYTDSAGVSNLYAYQLHSRFIPYLNVMLPLLKTPSKLKIKSSCMGVNSAIYQIVANYTRLDGTYVGGLFVGDDYVSLPIKDYTYIVNLGIRSSVSGSLVAEPFKITIYTAQCLGPSAVNSTQQVVIGGTGTCCNEFPLNTQRSEFTSVQGAMIPNLVSLNEVVVNAPAYFTFFIGNLIFPGSFDFSSKILWDPTNYGSRATSIYEGTIHSECGGLYPRFENNIQIITSSGTVDIDSYIASFFSENKIYDDPKTKTNTVIPIQLKVIQPTSSCEFSQLEKYVGAYYLKLATGGVMDVGFKGDNINLGLYSGPIPTSGPNSNYFVKCDNNIYASDVINPSSAADWSTSLPFGIGGSVKIAQNSSGYCQKGASLCSGRTGSFGSLFRNDIVSSCTDYFVNSTGNIKKQVGHFNEVCGNDISYSCDCAGVPVGGDGVVVSTSIPVTCTSAINYACPTTPPPTPPTCIAVCP